MTIQEFMHGINLPEEAQKIVLDYIITNDEYAWWKELFENDFQEFLEKWKKREDSLQWILAFYVRLSSEVYERYQAKQIPDTIYYDTFRDITIWCEECYHKHGEYGLEEVEWIAKSIRMELYRIGRLQYEPMLIKGCEESNLFQLPEGQRVLNVHIPAGEKLEFDTCEESMENARKFFGLDDTLMVCDSWLLSPKLKDILSETSNIIKFQNKFHIVKEHYKFPQAEERIFGEYRDDKESYPENTTLQRSAKAYLLAGGTIGIGVGKVFLK